MNNVRDFLGTKSIIEPSKELFSVILKRINYEKVRIARKNIFYSTIGAIMSSFVLYIGVDYANQGFIDSGFYNYFSLIFSDSASILNLWKEFTISLAESLPVLEITLVLTALLTLINSVGMMLENISNVSLLKLSK